MKGINHSLSRACRWALPLVLVLVIEAAAQAPGDLERYRSAVFSGKSAQALGMLVQPDEKVVLAGTAWPYPYDSTPPVIALARFNSDLTLDTSFGCSGGPCLGLVTEGFSGSAAAYAIGRQVGGEIVVAGSYAAPLSTTGQALVARFNSDGTLDTSFGTSSGKTLFDFELPGSDLKALAVQADSKIVVAGQATVARDPINPKFGLARLTSNGTLDTSFGCSTSGFCSGTVTLQVSGWDEAQAVGILPEGKIVVAGTTGPSSSGPFNFALARFNANGTVDTSFGNGGRVIVDFRRRNDYLNGMAVEWTCTAAPHKLGFCTDPANWYVGILMAGEAETPKGTDFGVARVWGDGSEDRNFGRRGEVTTDFSDGVDVARAVIGGPFGGTCPALCDARVVVAGETSGWNPVEGGYKKFALARYGAGGDLDTTFGSGGKAMIPLGRNPVASALAKQGDGKYVVGGSLMDPTGSWWEFVVFRVLP